MSYWKQENISNSQQILLKKYPLREQKKEKILRILKRKWLKLCLLGMIDFSCHFLQWNEIYWMSFSLEFSSILNLMYFLEKRSCWLLGLVWVKGVESIDDWQKHFFLNWKVCHRDERLSFSEDIEKGWTEWLIEFRFI